jgi:hypothetical protein
MEAYIAAGPVWVQVWINIMMVTIVASLIFVRGDWRPRLVILSMIPIVLLMTYLFNTFGYTRILGLAHIPFWTPLVVYLVRSFKPEDRQTWTGRYLYVITAVMCISLAFDFLDVARYLMGDTAPILVLPTSTTP